MTPKLVLEFTKMHGAGNDFVVLDNRFYYFSTEELARIAQLLCPRRTGIGADGLLALSMPDDPAHAYRMRYHNADGSVGEMCGNGARCLARFARAAGVTIEPLRFETDAGVYEARVPADPSADVRLLVPAPAGIVPAHSLHDASQDPVFALNAGVPHALRFVDDVETVDVNTEGAAIRHDASFPEGANVDFVEAKADGRLRVRTYERGVECETDACGTGAVAAAVGAALAGVLPAAPRFEVPVDMNGGTLTVGFTLSDGVPAKVYLDGPAVYVYRGTVEV